MRAFEIITESEGGIIRRAQEVSQGKPITFAKDDKKINLVSTTVIPETELKYETQPELEQGLKDALAALGNPTVYYYSKVQGKSGAALITSWEDENKKPIAFVKFSNVKKAGAFPITWTNADFGRETGYKQTDNKIAERAQFNIKPNTLFATDVDIPIATLPQQIKDKPDLSPEINQQINQLLSNVLTGSTTPVAGAEQYMTTYEVDLGESAAPIALATGNFVTGSYADAEKALLAPLGLTWKSIKSVLFPGGGSNLLYDSYLRLNNENTLKVSSKDKKGGAAAAVTGLLKDIEKNPERFSEVTNKPDYQRILEIVNVIASNSAITGPLELAVKFGFIDGTDSANVQQNLGKAIKYDPQLPWATTPGVQSAFKRKGAKFQDPAYDMGYHALAGIAELVADHLNKMPGMSDFFKAILERSTMIQVKSRIAKSSGGAFFNSFQVIYPPTFDGIIKVVAGNNYMSTRRPIGKISFKIP